MNDALKETFYCDFNHPVIRDLATQLSAGTNDPVEVATKSFYHVRDKLTYGFDLYKRKASETLKKGYGVCWNKSLLLIALLRCNLIPAQFGSIRVRREFVKPVVGLAYLLTNNPYNHCVALVYLNDKWVVLDTVLDKQTYDTCYLSQNITWGIDWDGRNDCKLYKEYAYNNAETHKDIDKAINNKVGNKEWPSFFAIMVNSLLNKRLWKKTKVSPVAYTI